MCKKKQAQTYVKDAQKNVAMLKSFGKSIRTASYKKNASGELKGEGRRLHRVLIPPS